MKTSILLLSMLLSACVTDANGTKRYVGPNHLRLHRVQRRIRGADPRWADAGR